ncbi:hypothetical protein MC885_009759 [Smutsia gigantea]|nr:hypothetical protein MC885_009759 [Smutsia gigantea]
MAELIQKELQGEVEKYQQLRKDLSKSMSGRQKLEAQRTENNTVKEELALLDGSDVVFKLLGPVLVKQTQAVSERNGKGSQSDLKILTMKLRQNVKPRQKVSGSLKITYSEYTNAAFRSPHMCQPRVKLRPYFDRTSPETICGI